MPTKQVTYWGVAEDFAPTSPVQVLDYLKYRGYKIPKHRQSKKETSNKEALEFLEVRNPDDPLLKMIVHSRHLSKAQGYLGESIIGRDGRVHATFTFVPKTGRLSSKAPNLMNLPQGRGAEVMARAADAIRGSFLPDPGYVFMEFDWKAIEALLVGYFAQDPDYMRVARLGVHAYVASHGIGQPADLSLPDADLIRYFEEIKESYPDAYAMYKKANHSGNYGQGINNLAKDLGVTPARAREIREIINRASPRVAAWKAATIRRAHSDGKLVNPFGYVQVFFAALQKNDFGEWEWGREANEVLAFLPQSTGAGMLRKSLLQVDALPSHQQVFDLLIPTHDSITIQVREAHLDEVGHQICEIMEQPWAELDGLRVEVDAKWGHNLRTMKKWKR